MNKLYVLPLHTIYLVLNILVRYGVTFNASVERKAKVAGSNNHVPVGSRTGTGCLVNSPLRSPHFHASWCPRSGDMSVLSQIFI
jgi:hypothetical protein